MGGPNIYLPRKGHYSSGRRVYTFDLCDLEGQGNFFLNHMVAHGHIRWGLFSYPYVKLWFLRHNETFSIQNVNFW